MRSEEVGKGMIILKKHRTKSGLIVALCDDDIVGKKFSENDAVLDLSSDFYKGEKKGDDEVLETCKNAYIINAVGNYAVSFLIKNDFVNEKNVIKVSGIPFVQCLLLQNEI